VQPSPSRALCCFALSLLCVCSRPVPARRTFEPTPADAAAAEEPAPDARTGLATLADGPAADRRVASPDATSDSRSPVDVAATPEPDARELEDGSASNAGADGPAAVAPIIVAVGDIAASGGSQAQTAQLVSALMKMKPLAAILTLGDHAYDSNTTSEFARYFTPTWGTPELMALIRPSPGNHEYQTRNAQGYFDYFNGAGQATGRAGDRTKGYYSFDLGDWHLLSLNSNDECEVVACDASSAQVAWLRAELEQHRGRCTLAYMHHPRFNEGLGHADTDAVAGLWDALYDGGADLVLAGHEHNFQQFAPMDKAGQVDRVKGVRSFVVGTGGVGHYTGFNSDHRAAEEFKNDTRFGVLEVTLGTGSYEWRFLAVGGTTLVSGNDRCR
jgi:hypothetical protein